MREKPNKGFSLLEALLAIVVIVVAGLGTYMLFDSGIKDNNISDATDEVVQIANVYTDLASSDLTTTATADTIVPLLQNSGRLSSKYFSSSNSGDSESATVQMNNAFGQLTYLSATPYSFSVKIPLGCQKAGSSIPEQLFNKVQDIYSCDADGSKDFSNCAVTSCSEGTSSSLTLYFNLNN